MPKLQIDMLPVGDADAFLVELERDETREVILIDGGKNWEDGERVLRQLDAYYGRRIDHLILSHVDVHHAGGLLHVVENLEPEQMGRAWVHDLSEHGVDVEKARDMARRLAEEAASEAVRTVATRMAESVETSQRLIETLEEKGIQVSSAFADGENRIGPFEVLGPTREFFADSVRFWADITMLDTMVEQGISFRRGRTAPVTAASADEILKQAIDNPLTAKHASLLLLLGYEGDKYFFPGDAGRKGFQACPNLRKAEDLHLLKVPNHGSKHNLSPLLIDHFHPDLAYISASGVGIDPHPALVEALKARGCVVYSTSTVGNVWHHRGEVPRREGFGRQRPL